ncbi:hypothetical protein K456DRAFT_57394 [Colletotrichum gloeosporioides 23]|nr:hypothetical protein K456DRAFT_57394 [Colletotrichum gloeosporioides 23]
MRDIRGMAKNEEVSTETLFLSDGKRWPNAEEYSSSLDIRAKHASACMQQPPVHQLQR